MTELRPETQSGLSSAIVNVVEWLSGVTNEVVQSGVRYTLLAPNENYDAIKLAERFVETLNDVSRRVAQTTDAIRQRLATARHELEEDKTSALEEVKAKIRPEWLGPRVLRARKAIAEYNALDKSAADEFRSESRYFYNQAREELDRRVADPDRFQSCLNLTLDQAEANLKQIRDGFYDYDRTGLSRKLGQLQAQTEILKSQLLSLEKEAA